jgi:hypothetical protein
MDLRRRSSIGGEFRVAGQADRVALGLAEEHGQEQFLDGKRLGRRTRFGTLAAAASCPRTGSTGQVTQLRSQTIYRLRGRFGLLNLTQALIAAPGWGGGHWHEKRLTCRVLGTRPE